MVRIATLSIALLTLCTLSFAQEATEQDRDRQYVTDQLRLSLYAQANSSSQVLKLLQSGALLEIEQIQGPYALVVTEDGTRGWVKRGFLVEEPTSNLLLLEEQRKTSELEAELEKLANSKVVIDQYEKDLQQMAAQMQGLQAEKQAAEESIAGLQQQIDAKQREIDRRNEPGIPALLVLWDTFQNYWQYIVPIILLIVLLSFLVSKAIIEARIKSRFHGIKIW
jgi:SH3 domain protein